ncbi:MAG: OB-fold nucleic acid binding domain-containing protein [Candidatus Aenigmatarchaeota archaeon]
MFALDKKFTVLICGVCSLVGLFLIYYISDITLPKEMEIESISPDQVGNFVSTKGTIVTRTLTKTGHLFLTLQGDERKIDVVMFSTFLTKEKVDPAKLKKGITLSINGMLEEYKGELQIVPKKAADVKIGR